MGQIIIYAHGREVLKRLWPDLQFTPETLDEIADHIASFSYAALKSCGAARTRRPNRKRRKQRGDYEQFSVYEIRRRGRARTVIVLIVLLLAAGAITVWRVVLAKPRGAANIIYLSGRIEGDDSAVSSKATGRLLEVKVREGDMVKAGDVIAVLDDQQVRAREAQAQATVAQTEAKLEWARKQIAVLEDQLRQNAVETGQSKVDAKWPREPGASRTGGGGSRTGAAGSRLQAGAVR